MRQHRRAGFPLIGSQLAGEVRFKFPPHETLIAYLRPDL